MPQQKPLIDLDKLDRNRGEQLKAIDGLAARLQPGIARDGYSVSVQALVSLMTKFDSLTSPQRPYTWHGIAHWSGMTGLSPKQCSRAISVLQSLQLIEARVTWVSHGKRGMKIAINWSTVFESGPITQDPEDLALWTARKTRQRTLFATRRTPKTTPVVSVSETDTMSVSVTDTMSVSERDIVSVSTISHPQIDSPNQSAEAEGRGPRAEGQRGEWVDEDFDSGTQPSTINHQHSPMTTIPREFDSLVHRLVLLGVQSARAICKRSLQVGYSLEQIAAILTWYEGERLHDRDLKAFYPYSPGQLACRLRDPDGIGVSPELGNWKGGKCGLWTSLAQKITPNPQKQARERHQATTDAIPVVRTTYTTPMAASEVLTALNDKHAPATVRQSYYRWAEGGPLPKTLAFWLKANGYRVDEIPETREESQR